MLGRRIPISSRVPDEMENVPSWASVSDERFVSLLMRMSAVFAWSSPARLRRVGPLTEGAWYGAASRNYRTFG